MTVLHLAVDVPDATADSDPMQVARFIVNKFNAVLVAEGSRKFDDPKQIGRDVLEATWRG